MANTKKSLTFRLTDGQTDLEFEIVIQMSENWYCAVTRFCTTSVTKHKPELKNISNFNSGEQVGHKSMSTVMLQIILGWFLWRNLALLLSSHSKKISKWSVTEFRNYFSTSQFLQFFQIKSENWLHPLLKCYSGIWSIDHTAQVSICWNIIFRENHSRIFLWIILGFFFFFWNGMIVICSYVLFIVKFICIQLDTFEILLYIECLGCTSKMDRKRW